MYGNNYKKYVYFCYEYQDKMKLVNRNWEKVKENWEKVMETWEKVMETWEKVMETLSLIKE